MQESGRKQSLQSSPQMPKRALKKSTSSQMLNQANAEKHKRNEKVEIEIEDSNAESDNSSNKRAEFDGSGFDKDLVAMVKRDILVTSPDIHWSDIAGILDLLKV
jgi:katanin p60 ATPase-containing subunit A1